MIRAISSVLQFRATVQTLEVDSRFRGNDDAGDGCPEYRHSRKSGNPPPRVRVSVRIKEVRSCALAWPPR
jgi:hypothetical protein